MTGAGHEAGAPDVSRRDGIVGAGWSGSTHDGAMAERILAAVPRGSRTLAVAGNAPPPTSHTDLGVPLGAHLARRRPGVREICISYARGCFYNLKPRQFRQSTKRRRQPRLSEHGSELILDWPSAKEAIWPHRPQPRPKR